MGFDSEKMDCEKLLQLIPSDDWQMAAAIKNGVMQHKHKAKLRPLQEAAIYFICGVLHGEDQMISRMDYLEGLVWDLEERNKELEDMLLEANKSTQDVKQEDDNHG